jgi:hypothetical protein
LGLKGRRLKEVEKTTKRGGLYCVLLTKYYFVIRSRRMRLAGHVARMGTGGVHRGFWWGNLRESDCLENLGIDGVSD